MRNKTAYALLLVTLLLPLHTAQAARGKLLGEEIYRLPSWFKDSFLEIHEDAKEAGQKKKHLMLFMHVDRCPYCTRMLNENFRQGEMARFIQNNFDVIALNIRGDREVMWDKNTRYTEKELAKKLKAYYTPTILFMNPKGEKVYQMHGYRQPAAFKQVLNYVKDGYYKNMKLVDYVRRNNESRYILRDHPRFMKLSDLSGIKGPLAVIFEDRSCADCDEFHEKVLNHREVLAELKNLTVVRLDAWSKENIIDVSGNRTTPEAWAKALKIDYRPGTVLFDFGEEVTRADGRLYHFHYKELLRYVSGRHYETYLSFPSYLGVRQRQLLDAGVTIDVGQ